MVYHSAKTSMKTAFRLLLFGNGAMSNITVKRTGLQPAAYFVR